MRKILVSISIISLARPTIYKTLESLCVQEFSHAYEINIILQGNLDKKKIKQINKKNIPIHIHNYKHGLGFGYYRNQAIEKSNGEILVWIDDDERTKDNMRLYYITKPIVEKKYKVVSAGTDIQLGKGYIADSISLLGYPGGGALGFKKMRKVNNDNTTFHLCSGNFAFDRSILDKTGLFKESLKSGAEDIAFAESINKQNIKILYKEESTVCHIHRSGFIDFCKWHFLRGKSTYEFSKLGIINKHHKKEKIKSIKNILFNRDMNIKYIRGVWFMFFIQYLFQIIGLFYGKYNNYFDKI